MDWQIWKGHNFPFAWPFLSVPVTSQTPNLLCYRDDCNIWRRSTFGVGISAAELQSHSHLYHNHQTWGGLQELGGGIDYSCASEETDQEKWNGEKELLYSPILTQPKKLIDVALPHLLCFSEIKPVVLSAKKQNWWSDELNVMRWSSWGYIRTRRRARKKAHQRKRKKDWWKEKAVVWQRNSFSNSIPGAAVSVACSRPPARSNCNNICYTWARLS